MLRATTCIDLTTLSGDDTFSNVQRLCFKAQHPIRDDLIEALDVKDLGMYVPTCFGEGWGWGGVGGKQR